MSQRILIVEDEVLIALDLAALLEDMGHEVVATTGDSRDALAWAREGIDIALVDLSLRDGPTGPALGETLARDWGATVIYLTATPRKVLACSAGPVGVLAKPCTDFDLAQAMRFAIALREGAAATRPPALRLLGGAPAQGACG